MTHRYSLIAAMLALLLLAVSANAGSSNMITVALSNETVKKMDVTLEVDDGTGGGETRLSPNMQGNFRFENTAHEQMGTHRNRFYLYRDGDIFAEIIVEIINQLKLSGPVIEDFKAYVARNELGCEIRITPAKTGNQLKVVIIVSDCTG